MTCLRQEIVMALQEVAAAMQRIESVLRRRPSTGLHDDAAAISRWQGGLSVMSTHPNGSRVATDMPTEIGGSGDEVSPGWLLRAGVASCVATRIAMGAAARGIVLTDLEVTATSRSDTRGLLGIADEHGGRVSAGPQEVGLQIRISAADASPESLHALVEDAYRCSPVAVALRDIVPVRLQIEPRAD
jgi:uncharacterized OsmC-like protein